MYQSPFQLLGLVTKLAILKSAKTLTLLSLISHKAMVIWRFGPMKPSRIDYQSGYILETTVQWPVYTCMASKWRKRLKRFWVSGVSFANGNNPMAAILKHWRTENIRSKSRLMRLPLALLIGPIIIGNYVYSQGLEVDLGLELLFCYILTSMTW